LVGRSGKDVVSPSDPCHADEKPLQFSLPTRLAQQSPRALLFASAGGIRANRVDQKRRQSFGVFVDVRGEASVVFVQVPDRRAWRRCKDKTSDRSALFGFLLVLCRIEAVEYRFHVHGLSSFLSLDAAVEDGERRVDGADHLLRLPSSLSELLLLSD